MSSTLTNPTHPCYLSPGDGVMQNTILFRPGMKTLYAVWMASVIMLLVGDRSTGYLAIGIGIFSALIVALGRWTLPSGDDEPADALKQDGPRSLLAVRGVVLLMTFTWLMLFGTSLTMNIPLITGLLPLLLRIHTNLPRGGLAPFLALTCAVIPGLLLLAFGVRPRQLGLRWVSGGRLRFFCWIAIPLGTAAWSIITGRFSLLQVILIFLENALLNGFPEEFLFRGAILSYFRAFLRTDWAFFLQALLFSLAHAGITIPEEHGKILLIVANVLAENIPVALIFGLMALRSRSLALGATVHFAMDAMAKLLLVQH